MKKALSLFLALALCLSLCACGGVKAPAKNDVKADLQEALLDKNPYAELKSAEVDRSLADGNHYEVTYNVIAKTKYADWTYQVKLNYTNYDQGWKLDSIDWLSEKYDQVRYPSADELESLVNNGEDKNAARYLYDLVPVKNGEIDSSDVSKTGLLKITWAEESDYQHATHTEYTSVYWCYDAANDVWKITEYKKGHIEENRIKNVVKRGVDFCGSWVMSDGANISITAWSEDKVTVKINGETYQFSRTDRSNEGVYKYEDGNRMMIGFDFHQDTTYASISRGTTMLYLFDVS